MDYQEILKMAIANEVEAYEFYSAVAEKNLEPQLKNLFAELAAEEFDHRKILEAFFNNPEKPLKFKKVDDYKVSETVAGSALSIEMKPVDAITLAMKKEEEAMNAYNEFARNSVNADQEAIFLELAKMEQGHKVRLESIYTNMAFPEVW